MKKNNTHITEATQGKVTMSNFVSLDSTGEKFSPAPNVKVKTTIFALSINNEDSVQMMKIPTEKNLLPAPLSKIKQCIFAT